MTKIKGIKNLVALMAFIILLGPVVGAVNASQLEDRTPSSYDECQALNDSTLRGLWGKSDLIEFGNGLTNVGIQVNQGSGTQTCTINGTALSGPGTQVQALPSHISTTLQSMQRLFQRFRR